MIFYLLELLTTWLECAQSDVQQKTTNLHTFNLIRSFYSNELVDGPNPLQTNQLNEKNVPCTDGL